MDIGGWLRELGLERYEQAFRENEIDLRVLPKLTTEDLKELGVAAIGHRRLLIDAIAALPAGGAGAAADAALAPPTRQAAAEAERRQLTVMFCDLVGSTSLSIRFDPEDLREIVGAYHRCVTDTVGHFGGFVARYMGDGVLIYFGYPEAHEDDAERAARAGLAVIDAVGRLATQEPLNVRIGVATGLVVVGDLIGAGAAQERGVVGETPNLAARLQALARPGTLCSPSESPQQFAGSWGRWTRQISDCGDRLSRRAFARGRHSPSAEGDPGRAGGGNTEFRLTHCWRKTDSNSRSHREGKAMGSHSTQASPSRT